MPKDACVYCCQYCGSCCIDKSQSLVWHQSTIDRICQFLRTKFHYIGRQLTRPSWAGAYNLRSISALRPKGLVHETIANIGSIFCNLHKNRADTSCIKKIDPIFLQLVQNSTWYFFAKSITPVFSWKSTHQSTHSLETNRASYCDSLLWVLIPQLQMCIMHRLIILGSYIL